MIGMLRLGAILIVVLAIIFVVTRLRQRRDLRRQYSAEWQAGDQMQPEEAFIDDKIAAWESSWRGRALWLIFAIPLLIVIIFFLIANY